MGKIIRSSVLAMMFLFLKEMNAQSFLGLDGGFEGTATIDNTGSSTGAQSGAWTRQGTVSSIADEIGTVRSGNHSMKISSISTTLARIYSPQYTISSNTSKWYVQYYRRSASTTNTQQQEAGSIRDSTEGANSSYTTVSTANTWEKVTYNSTSTTAATTVAGLIRNEALGGGGDMFIDDFCIYADASIDNSAPSSPTSFAVTGTTTSSIDLGWNTASGGVDGGGYMLVRYTSSPAANDDPNVNGIYANGETITGSVNGTIIYIGTGTSYTDAGLNTSTTYYYKVYTFDKAYNYSSEQSISGTTAGTTIFQSATSGNWNNLSTWASNSGSGWVTPAASIPDYTQGAITIQSGHTVTITADVTIDEVTVSSNATLILDTSSTLTLNDAPGGADLIIDGTFIDESASHGLDTATNAKWKFGSAGTFVKANHSAVTIWRDAYENGMINIPHGSTWIVRQAFASVTVSASGMYYGNLIIENTSVNRWNASVTQTFSGGTAPVIYGDLNIGGTGSGKVNFADTLTVPLTVNGNLFVQNGDTLTLKGSEVDVKKDFTGGSSTASYINGTGKLVLNGTSQQHLSGKTNFQTLQLNNSSNAQMQSGAVIGIYKALQLKQGTFDVNNQSLTFYSQSTSNYAYLDNFSSGFSGSLSGSVTAQLTVPVGGTNQHYIGSPVSAMLAQLNPSGTGGYITPTSNCDETRSGGGAYGTVFSWDETHPTTCPLSGWYVETNSGTTIPQGQGYSVYLSSGTFSMNGAVNQNASYSVNNLANTGYLLSTLQRSNSFSSGWHLLSNPYLAPYDVVGSYQSGGINNGSFDEADIWVASGRFSGTYQPLTTSSLLAPFQGVMVHRGNGGLLQTAQSAASFQFSKNYLRTPATLPQFTRQTSENAMSVSIAGNGFEDITYVSFSDSATSAFDIGYDTHKMMSAIGQPTIYTLMNGEKMSSNVNHSMDDVSEIPLSVSPGASGTFTFTFDGTTSFDPTSYVFLEDKTAGIFQDVRANSSYTFTMNASDSANRFMLHFTPPAQISTDDATCVSNGAINISQSGSAKWNYQIADSNSAIIASGILDSTTLLSINAPKGIYSLTLIDSNGYMVNEEIEVSGAQAVSATLHTSADSVETNENITFTSSAANASFYEWNFGDGFFASASNATHSYATEGIYNVSLTASNADGCSDVKTQPVTVTAKTVSGLNNLADNNAIKIWSNSNTVFVDFSSSKTGAVIDIFNMLGQQLSSERFARSSVYFKTLENISTGYLLVRVKSEKETTAKKVLVGK